MRMGIGDLGIVELERPNAAFLLMPRSATCEQFSRWS
jgi:hypothetical protein